MRRFERGWEGKEVGEVEKRRCREKGELETEVGRHLRKERGCKAREGKGRQRLEEQQMERGWEKRRGANQI